MSGSLHPTAIHRRQQRRAKRHKLRSQIAAAPAHGRAAFEAKLQKTYALGFGQSSPKAPAAPATPAAPAEPAAPVPSV